MGPKWLVGIVAFVSILTVIFTGCLSNNGNNNGNDPIPGLASVGPLFSQWEDWTNDDIDDGLRIGFYFWAENDTQLFFDNVDVDVQIELYTQVFLDGQGQKDRLVYSETHTITSSEDIHPLHGDGIRIPKGEISVNPNVDSEIGVLEVTAIISDQEQYPLPPDNLVRLYE